MGARGEAQRWGIGHLPLSWELFESWQPRFVRSTEVSADDLDGYEYWRRERGGT
jgi:hypothetical protein